MFSGHLPLVVAGVTGPGREGSGVTVAAFVGVFVVDGEGVRAVVTGGTPGGGGMACGAI